MRRKSQFLCLLTVLLVNCEKAEASALQGTYISIGSQTLAPYGWVGFCERYKSECIAGELKKLDVNATPKAMKLIEKINKWVNSNITAKSDLEQWGTVDRWDYPTNGFGDCEDYVLLKRKMLIEEGFPRQALLVTTVKDEQGEGHAVLTVRTTKGEFVLDNLNDDVKRWDRTPYRFLKRQSQENENVWVRIGAPTSSPNLVARDTSQEDLPVPKQQPTPTIAKSEEKAAPAPRVPVTVSSAQQGSILSAGGAAVSPTGWTEFCRRYENECKAGFLAARDINLFNGATKKQIEKTNTEINNTIMAKSDFEQWGFSDRWDYPSNGFGDSEDYVLLKRKMLMDEGLPRQALLMTIVLDEQDELHTVLTVKATTGSYVLDNRNNELKIWYETPYRFVKRQSQENENDWVRLEVSAPEPTPVPAARNVQEASPPERPATQAQSALKGTYISVGGQTLVPYGWVDFCARHVGECNTGTLQPLDINATDKALKIINKINLAVNKSIKGRSDLKQWGTVDRWDFPSNGFGDCEDYALLKRKKLIEEGFPRQALLITVVKDEQGEGHAVLTVKTNRGEFVLDNLTDKVKRWDKTPYRFVKRQSQQDQRIWVNIGAPTSAPAMVGR